MAHSPPHNSTPAIRSPMRELVAVSLPAIATMVSPAIMQFVDARLVAEISPTALAAQGNGSMLAFIAMGTLIGLVSVVNTFAAQHLGAGRTERAARFGWSAIWISALGAAVVAPLAFFAAPIFRAMGHPEELVLLETQYAFILLLFAIFPAVASRGLGQFFYGIQRGGIVLIATVTGNIVNIGLSYVLIFGKFGAPELGVAGAAIGTVVGHGFELLIPLALFLSPKFDSVYQSRSQWRPSRGALRDVLKIGWPAGLHFGNEITCWALFMAWVVSSFGPAQAAASYIALNWMKLSFLPAVGLSHGVTSVVGASIGRRDMDGAMHRGMLGLWLGLGYMGTTGLCMVVFREPMARFFLPDSGDPEVIAAAMAVAPTLLVFAAFFQLFDALGIVMSGALRGAGDTTWPGVLVVICAWTILIGLGWAIALVFPEWGSRGPWIAASLFLAVTGVAMLVRFRRGKWQTIRLLDEDDPEAPPRPGAVVEPAAGLEHPTLAEPARPAAG